MGNLGFQELMLIFVIALIVFGPRKLPELGKAIGKGLAEFRRASNELRSTWEEEVRMEDLKKLEKMADPYDHSSYSAPHSAPSTPSSDSYGTADATPVETTPPVTPEASKPSTKEPGKA